MIGHISTNTLLKVFCLFGERQKFSLNENWKIVSRCYFVKIYISLELSLSYESWCADHDSVPRFGHKLLGRETWALENREFSKSLISKLWHSSICLFCKHYFFGIDTVRSYFPSISIRNAKVTKYTKVTLSEFHSKWDSLVTPRPNESIFVFSSFLNVWAIVC